MYREFKQELKNLAQEIRNKKSKRKESQYGYVAGLLDDQWEFRCKHIAYCILRFNRTIEEIEIKTHDDEFTINERNRAVNNYVTQYRQHIVEKAA